MLGIRNLTIGVNCKERAKTGEQCDNQSNGQL